MRIEIHHYHHLYECESESLSLIRQIFKGLKEGTFIMALSPEMQAFVDSVTAALSNAGASLENINADIQRLLSASTGLSAEDKAALVAVTEQLGNLATSLAEAAAVVPE